METSYQNITLKTFRTANRKTAYNLCLLYRVCLSYIIMFIFWICLDSDFKLISIVVLENNKIKLLRDKETAFPNKNKLKCTILFYSLFISSQNNKRSL